MHCSQLHCKNVVTIVPADNAIIGGFDFDGQPLHICRAKHSGAIIPGKAKPNGFGCVVTHELKERLFIKRYEFFVEPNEQKANWVSNKDKPKNMFIVSKINSCEVYIGRYDVKNANYNGVNPILMSNNRLFLVFNYNIQETKFCEFSYNNQEIQKTQF